MASQLPKHHLLNNYSLSHLLKSHLYYLLNSHVSLPLVQYALFYSIGMSAFSAPVSNHSSDYTIQCSIWSAYSFFFFSELYYLALYLFYMIFNLILKLYSPENTL